MHSSLRTHPELYELSKTFRSFHFCSEVIQDSIWYIRIGAILRYDFDSCASCVENELRKVQHSNEILKSNDACDAAGGKLTVTLHFETATEALRLHYDAMQAAYEALRAPFWKHSKLEKIDDQIKKIYGTLDGFLRMGLPEDILPHPDPSSNPFLDPPVELDDHSLIELEIHSHVELNAQSFVELEAHAPPTASPKSRESDLSDCPSILAPARPSIHRFHAPSPTVPQHRSQPPRPYRSPKYHASRPAPPPPSHKRWGSEYRDLQ